ncbi:MAG: 50S ribosomal protein L30 [Blastocatellia bacterium]|nr:50S ribosomal protein L30 [Blastocatellia bacterium]
MSLDNEKKLIKVKWYRSSICTPKKHKDIVKVFGFRKLNQILEKPDNAATRGVVAKVPHLLTIIED